MFEPSFNNVNSSKPVDEHLWERFKKFVLLLAYFLGKFVNVSKTNIVKSTVYAYQHGLFMYVPKNLGQHGVVPRDAMVAIDELISEGKLIPRKNFKIIPKAKLFGDVEIRRVEVNELIVPVSLQDEVPTITKELNLPQQVLERLAHDLSKTLGSPNTKVQEKISLDPIIHILEKEKSLDQCAYHKYATLWDTAEEISFFGIEQVKFGENIDIPYPKFYKVKSDPIKRNFKLAMKLIRNKSELPPKHFWVSSVHKEYARLRENVIGTVCLFSGFLCEPLKKDETSITYITTLTESAYLYHPYMQVRLILDADVTASYFAPLTDIFNYEYLVIGKITENMNQPAVRCYGLIAIDKLPETIKRIWGIDEISLCK
ncbi:MAG: hypothetical protein QXJ62_01340 [Nitrososphaeria archaeon]